MAQRTADVTWEGDLMSGQGTIKFGTGALPETTVTFPARIEDPRGRTSPEELLAAAHASCYAMAFSNTLATGGNPPESLQVNAKATLEKLESGLKVTTMELNVKGKVPGIDQAQFEEAARTAEAKCPISNTIRNNVDIRLNAQLE